MEKGHAPDRFFLWITVAIFCAGLAILASASVPLAQREFGNPLAYLIRQLTIGASFGVLGAFAAHVIPLPWFRTFAVPLFFGTVLLLVAVLVPGIGVGSGGATRWIQAGPLTIQPGEIAKIALPMYLAAWFATHLPALRRKKSKEKEDGPGEEASMLVPFLVIVGAVGLPLVLQPDISTLGVLSLTALVMFFLAGAPLRSIALLIGGGLAALLVLIRLAPYRMNRITAFLDPQSDPLGIGYQVNQALLAVGSGGVFGRGIGFSREKLFFLPEPMGDSVFAVFAEEAGFVGAFTLILFFVLFCWRGFAITRRIPDPFLRLFAAGLVSWIIVQAFINIGGNIGLLPLVGVTLPFVSYGSASLAVAITSAAVLYRLSRYTR